MLNLAAKITAPFGLGIALLAFAFLIPRPAREEVKRVEPPHASLHFNSLGTIEVTFISDSLIFSPELFCDEPGVLFHRYPNYCWHRWTHDGQP